MFTVGLLDPLSSGRIVQVRAGSNSPHLGKGLHVPPPFDGYSPLPLKADNIVNAPYTLCSFYLAGMPFVEYRLAHRMHAAAPMNYSKVFLLSCRVDIELADVLFLYLRDPPQRMHYCILKRWRGSIFY